MRWTGSLVLCLLLVMAGASPLAVASSHYAVEVSPAVDTPTRTVDFQSRTYAVSSVGRVDPGDRFTATVSAPAGDEYDVRLYDADGRVVDFASRSGSGSVEFDTASETSSYDPGTYFVAVRHHGATVAVQPVVLSAYEVTATAPDSIEEGGMIHVSASLESVAVDEHVESVSVFVGNDDVVRRAELRKRGTGEYGATIGLDGLPPGEYDLTVVAHGPATVAGEREMIGVSDSRSLEITSSSGVSAPTGSVDEGGGSGAGATETTIDDEIAAPDESTGGDPPTTTAPAESSDEDVITPGMDTESSVRAAQTSVSLDWGDVPLLVLAVVLLLWRIRG